MEKLMEKFNYNGKDLFIGSIAEGHESIKHHMLAHFVLDETENNDNEWFLRFNSQIKEMNNFIEISKDKKILFDIGSQFCSFSFSFLGNSLDKIAFAFDGGTNPYLTTTQIKIINNLNNLHIFNFLIGNKNESVKCFSEELQSLAIPGDDRRLMFSIDMLSNMYNIGPDVMKIDIEGYEYQALMGAYNTIIKYKPIIFIEVHPEFLSHYNNYIENIIEFTKKINYTILDLDKNEVLNYYDILKMEKTASNRTIWMPNN